MQEHVREKNEQNHKECEIPRQHDCVHRKENGIEKETIHKDKQKTPL